MTRNATIPKATILAVAMVCGSAAFLYSLYAGSTHDRRARDAANAARRGLSNMAVDFARPRDRKGLEKAAAENPNNVTIFFDLARLADAEGDTVAATKYWTATFTMASELAAADPSRLRSAFMAAWAGDRLGKTEQAQASFRTIALAQENMLRDGRGGRGDPRASLQRLGWCYAKSGQPDAARDAWTSALRMLEERPRDSLGPEEVYDTGCLLALTGKKEEALAALTDAVRAGFGDDEWARADEDLESVRGEARFKEILVRMHEQRMRRDAAQ